MSDTIYRDDAVRAVCKGCLKENPHCRHHWDCLVLTNLGKLPSADRWIPCNERMPEETGVYLCTVGAPYRNPREMFYAPQEWADKSDNATWKSTDGCYVYDWFVEAWQPLPEPYERGTDDD